METNSPRYHYRARRFIDAERAESLRVGKCYVEAAQRRLGLVMSRLGIISAQCLCLAGYGSWVVDVDADPVRLGVFAACGIEGGPA
jgi:hypothetical protein